jgi:hypothetical protein
MDAVWQRFVRGVTRAARKEALGRTVVKLAWTAGPVTFLALQGGYFLGYGHSAPAALWYYFGGYTVITGLVAVAIRVAYNATRGEQIEDGRAALAWLLRAFPHLILRTRNENLAYFDENNRRVLAAWELLDNPDAGPHAVEIAIGTLTGSPQLAASAARIETYRRSGLQVLIDDERTHIGEELAAALTELKKWSPQLAELIDRRMHGDAPLASRGRARTAGFIERILSAGEHEDYTLMTFKDAEEAFILALELLAGREFPYLKPEYIGGRTFMEASRSLDRARRAYRAAVYARNGRLRILMELLAETDAVHQVAPTMATLTNLRQNSKAVFVAIDEEVKNLADAAAMNKTRTHVRSRIYNLRKVVELYKQFFRQNELAARRLADLAGAETRYHQAHERSGRHFTPRLLGPKDRGYGIRIRRHTLSPPEEERIDLARQIGSVIPDSFGGIDEIEVKEAAFRTVAELSRRLDLDRWEIQFAIETNNSSYLSYLDPGLTTQTQAGWIISIANDVRWNPIPPLRRLTRILVQYHEMDLDQDSIHRLAEEFEVPPDSLYGVGVVEEPSRKEQAKTFAHLDLPKPDPSWDRTIRRVSGQAR